ncbi:MAG TPA: tetratricopeptide repeat protein [Myxococcota bacterium]|nr:tetratricopeptide repeat protein [Myxococcota bacterium]HRY96084.1 tetratricopeptide repeat protein [Myxococcota bacterium]HSA21605.1 tetratricopeptide repeat protein [Myxococcota bacterium]
MRARSLCCFLLGLALWGAGVGAVWALDRWNLWFPGESERLRLAFAEARDLGRHAEALAALDQLAEREHDAWLLIDRAEILSALGRPAEAVSLYLEAQARGERGAWLLDRLAEAQAAAGDLDGAIHDLVRAIDQDARPWGDERRFLAELLARAGLPADGGWWRRSSGFRLVTSAAGRAVCAPEERLVGGGCGREGWLLACPAPLGADWPSAPGDQHRRLGGAHACPPAERAETWALCAGPLRAEAEDRGD